MSYNTNYYPERGQDALQQHQGPRSERFLRDAEEEDGVMLDDGNAHPFDGGNDFVDDAVYLSPGSSEQASILPLAREMRNEACFCDITFVVQGRMFRAHRIIVSAWSRWLRALLSEDDGGGHSSSGHAEGGGAAGSALPLDQFDPDAFGAVLDYMYGGELRLSIENSDQIIKVVRRLELRQLEQECWKCLLSAVDRTNCKKLHELADRFDCPPLKLSAWHILQETSQGYAANPSSRLLNPMTDGDAMRLTPPSMAAYLLKGTGLTGPGEFAGADGASPKGRGGSSGAAENADPNALETGSDEGDRPMHLSVFADYSHQYGHEGGSVYSSEMSESHALLPEQLPPGAPAAAVIKAWAYKLQLLYELCSPRGLHDDLNHQRGGINNSSYNADYSQRPEQNNEYNDAQFGGSNASNEYSASPSDARNQLISFYNERGLFDRISYVDNALATFRGRENEMFEMLRDKYDAPESPDYVPPSARRSRTVPTSNANQQNVFRKPSFGVAQASEAKHDELSLESHTPLPRQESSMSQDSKKRSMLQMFRLGSS